MRKDTFRQTRRPCAGRRISACLALAAAAALPTCASAAGTVYTWTGSTSTSWETAGNWTPTTGYPSNAGTAGTAGTGDTAEFNGAAGTNQPTLTASESIGEVYFLAGSSNWNVGSNSSSNTLTLSGGGFTAGVAINDAATTGTNTISANLGFDVNQTWETSGGTLVISGTVTSTETSNVGDYTLTIAGSGTIQVTNNNSGFEDSVTNSGTGTLDLTGNGVLGAYYLTLNSGTVLLDNTATATSYRLGNPSANNSNSLVLFNGGNLTIKGNANTAVVESLGNVYLNETLTLSGSTPTLTANTSFNGYSTIQISPASGASPNASPSLTLASITRPTTDGPILFVNGTGLGTTGSGGYGQIVVSSSAGLSLTGGQQTGTTDNPAIQNAEIVPYLVGEVPVTSGAVGSQTGTPDTFVAYTSSDSLRPLNPVDEYSDNAIVSGDNIYITSTGATASSSNSINSLVINGGNLAINSGVTLTNASGALLYVTSNGVTGSGTMAFGSNEIIATVNSGVTGTLGTITGSGNLNLTGSGVLDLTGVSPSFTGNVYINSNTLQFGNRTSGDDGNLPNAANIYFANLSGNSALAFENTTTQTINAAIQAPSNGNIMNIYDVGLGGIDFKGNLVLNSGVGEPFVWLYGGNGAGPITFDGPISQVGATNVGSIYIEVATNGGVTFNDTDAAAYVRLYLQSVPTANLYGTYTPPLVNGSIPNMSVTLSSSGSIGSVLFNGTGATATPITGSTNSGIYFTNLNRSATATTATSPVYFFQNGPINGSGTANATTTYDGYWSGAAVWYVNNDLAASTSLEIEYNSHGEGTTPNVGAMYVAPNELVTVAPFSSNTQSGAFVVGYGNYSTDISGDYGYLSIGAGSNVYDNGTANSFYAGLESNAQVDMLNSTAASPSTLGIYDRLYIDAGGTGFSGVQDTVNIGTNDTLTVGNFNGNGTVAGITANGDSIAMNALNSVYATAVLSINGGTVNNINSSKSFTSGNTNVYISLFGTGGNDNHLVTNLSPGIVNLGSYSSPSAGGTLRTGYVKAETISAAISGTTYYGDNSAYLNFNGGELDYNGTNSLQSVQGTFLQYNLNSAFVNQGGATIGTTYANSGYTGNTVASTVPLLAPPGSGIYQITVTNAGSGYVAPPQVEITDAQGGDASAYAVIDSVYGDPNYGKVTSIIVTNPGFNMSDPTILLVGGGGSGATATAAIEANDGYLNSSNFSTTSLGGVTKTQSGMLQLVGTYEGTNSTDTSDFSFTTSGTSAQVITGVAAAGAATGANLGNDPAVGSGNAANYIRNNTSTYTGPTVISTGTLALITAKSPSVTGAGTVTTFPATNNNIPYSSMIVVGDVPTFVGGAPTSTAVLQLYGATGYTSPNYTSSGIGGTGGFELAPVLSSGSGQQIGQILSGFGTIQGSSSVPLTIGYNPTGNNFGQASSTTFTSNNSMIAPGYTPNTGTNAGGQPLGTNWQGYPFSTAQGGSAGATTPQTGVLTITGSLPASLSQTGAAQTNGTMVTNFGAGGDYYWKVNLATASGGATTTPGVQGVQNSSSTLSTANAAVNGAAWDALVVDSLNATVTPGSPFFVQAVGFGTQSASGVQIGGSFTQDYSWVIAHAGDTSISPSLVADLYLNPSGLPSPAAGYGYYLTADNDPTGGTDLVVNYAPVPEPTALVLLAPAAGALLLRRRRAARTLA